MDLQLVGIVLLFGAVLTLVGWWLYKSVATRRLFGWRPWRGSFGIIERSGHPFYYWGGVFGLVAITLICLGWLSFLVPAAIQGKRLHSRFDDGTAVFNNEGVRCPGDPPGFTHFHSCMGPPVPVPM